VRVVVLGMMGSYPFGGQSWLYVNWLLALRRLGHEVWYVEDNGVWQYDPTVDSFTDSCGYATQHVHDVLDRVGLGDRWAYRWPGSGKCWGRTAHQLAELYRTCDVLLNVCVATDLRDEHMVAPARVWVETDPVVDQLRVAAGDGRVREQMLERHTHFASYGENYGAPDCKVPLHGVDFVKTRQPIDLGEWPYLHDADAPYFTTIANYRVDVHDIEVDGEVYGWSKHQQWQRVLDLPRRTTQPFELALTATPDDADHMRRHGWGVVRALEMSLDVYGAYRRFIQESRGEFSVAKDQNIRLRSGWFSERDACYLASGKPVVAQDTAFVLPTGQGLFSFTTVEEAAAAIEEVNGDYGRHCRAARALAEEYFDGPPVVGRMLAELGLE